MERGGFLFVTGHLETGGLERQLVTLLSALDRERFPVSIAVVGPREETQMSRALREMGVTIHPIEGSRPRKALRLRSLVRERRPDVVHSYTFFTNALAAWATIGTRSVVVGSLRSDLAYAKKEAGPLLGRWSARWPRFQVANNAAGAREATRAPGPWRPHEMVVVRNGIDVAAFHPLPPARPGVAVIAGMGRLVPVKRWDVAIDAAAILAAQGRDFELRIAGAGPLERELIARARERGVTDRVKLVGEVKDIVGFLAPASIVVLTSDAEGMPNAVLEAMACERVVVATDVGDVASVVADGKTGFVVPRRDPQALAARLAILLDDRTRREELARAGSASVRSEFGAAALVRDTLAAYEAAGWRRQR